MRVYFLSKIKAGIRLNGLFLGFADMFERHVELNLHDGVFAEFIPEGNYLSVNFFIDDRLLSAPPDFLDIYLMDEDILIYVKEYAPKTANFKVISQTRFCQNLVTVFAQGKLQLAFDGNEYFLHELCDDFCNCSFEEVKINKFPVLAIKGGEYLALLSQSGELIFFNKVQSYSFAEGLKVCVCFETCLKSHAECLFLYDGEKLSLAESKTIEEESADDEIIQFAFFESLLTCGDYSKYLCEDLLEKAAYLKEYLGDFCDVTIPPEKFFIKHGEIKVAGLVYPKSKNLFEVKYYKIEVENGKITNLYPVE